MSTRSPYFSRLSCGLALVLIAGLFGLLIALGGRLFSPGPLTAAHSQNRPLQGFTSHADFETECSRCHAPLLGPSAERCLICHDTVTTEIKDGTPLHGVLDKVENCTACHPDHLGPAASITRVDAQDFPHQAATGFTLAQHQLDYAGLAIACTACHTVPGYRFDLAACGQCHDPAQPAFMREHQALFGENCLACHDGTGQSEPFEHTTFFPLDGAHTTVACLGCHRDDQFEGTPRDCYSCHAADDVHNGQLGTECAACHTPSTWQQATIPAHTFPITHQNGGQPIPCQTCHAFTYRAYSCFGCHEHNPVEIEHKHLEEGIPDFQNCVSCHPTGREPEAEDVDHDRPERDFEQDDDRNSDDDRNDD